MCLIHRQMSVSVASDEFLWKHGGTLPQYYWSMHDPLPLILASTQFSSFVCFSIRFGYKACDQKLIWSIIWHLLWWINHFKHMQAGH
jgi:hypothetical protein